MTEVDRTYLSRQKVRAGKLYPGNLEFLSLQCLRKIRHVFGEIGINATFLSILKREKAFELTFLDECDIFLHNGCVLQSSDRRETRMKPNLQGMMKQIQERIAQTQSALERMTVTADAGGGMVKVTANGRQQVTKIEIEKEVVNPEDISMLEDLVVAAVNKALEESTKMAQEEMAKATSGLLPNIPGLNIPGL